MSFVPEDKIKWEELAPSLQIFKLYQFSYRNLI